MTTRVGLGCGAGRWLLAIVVALLAFGPPAAATAAEPLDTRITSSPANLHRGTYAVFVFEGRVGASDWGTCAYDPDLDEFVCASEFECSLDGAAWSACRPVLTLRDLADGFHVFAVRATDGITTDPSPATHVFRVQAYDLCPGATAALEKARSDEAEGREYRSGIIENIRGFKRELKAAETPRPVERIREQLRYQRQRLKKIRSRVSEARAARKAAEAQHAAACA